MKVGLRGSVWVDVVVLELVWATEVAFERARKALEMPWDGTKVLWVVFVLPSGLGRVVLVVVSSIVAGLSNAISDMVAVRLCIDVSKVAERCQCLRNFRA